MLAYLLAQKKDTIDFNFETTYRLNEINDCIVSFLVHDQTHMSYLKCWERWHRSNSVYSITSILSLSGMYADPGMTELGTVQMFMD